INVAASPAAATAVAIVAAIAATRATPAVALRLAAAALNSPAHSVLRTTTSASRPATYTTAAADRASSNKSQASGDEPGAWLLFGPTGGVMDCLTQLAH